MPVRYWTGPAATIIVHVGAASHNNTEPIQWINRVVGMMRRLTAIALVAAGFLAAAYGLHARPTAATSAGRCAQVCGAGSAHPQAAAQVAAAGSGAVEPAGHRTGLIMAMPGPHGQVITDDYMLTLYRSDRDAAAPSAATCTDACTATWLPVLVDRTPSYDGGDAAQVTTVVRADGSKQLTLRGAPLYRYVGDVAEGDAKGDGIDGSWHAATP
jgi:predicted lipoprotein with Yx(FWY)xxD motif